MAENCVFLDTNGWFALLNKDDILHRHACTSWELHVRGYCSFVLTDWIIAETGNGLSRTPQRGLFPQAVRGMQLSPRVHIQSVTQETLKRALDLYENRPDKNWGLVDCASFVIMKAEGITQAFTTDRHFEQAGFVCLLPARPA